MIKAAIEISKSPFYRFAFLDLDSDFDFLK